jgi:hypothetical protein
LDDRDETAAGGEPVDAPETRVEAGEKRSFRDRFPLKTVIALVLIVLLGLPVFSLLQPRYYERYEDLGPRMENWRESTHARISCSSCHIEPGIGGFVSFATKAIPAFYSQLLHGPRPENLLSTPGREACQRCHTGYRQVSATGDLLIPHQAHVEVLELDCAVCHEELVHADNTQGFNAPKMTMCLELCHDGEQASAECTDCHTRKQVPDDHLREDWLLVHSEMVDTVDCGECHAWSPDYCADCHAERPEGHAGNWKKLHQYPALERGRDGCMTCHDEESCLECHDPWDED